MTKRDDAKRGNSVPRCFLGGASILALHCTGLKADHEGGGAGSAESGVDASDAATAERGGDARLDARDGPGGDGGDSPTDGPDADGPSDGPDGDGPADGDDGPTDGPDTDGGDSPSDGPAEDACASTCAEIGALQCGSDGAVQACEERAGCRQWRDLARCPSESICCGGLCVQINGENCFGCGARCGDVRPICDRTIHACGCDGPTCAAAGKICEPASHTCIDPSPPPGFDFYVSAKALDEHGDGTAARPFRTITAAIAAITPPRAARVYVAPGRYTASSGEEFPLVLRGGVSLFGAGADRTIVSGLGVHDPPPTNVGYPDPFYATVIAGDLDVSTALSSLTLESGSPVVTTSNFGVFCDRGNAKDPDAKANTLLSDLSIGPDYFVGIVATGSSAPIDSGCNLRLTSSSLHDAAYGIWGFGCIVPQFRSVPVALEVGDGIQDHGNHFSGMTKLDNTGDGILVSGCVRDLSASFNTFVDLNGGMHLDQTGDPTISARAALSNNSFERLTNYGIYLTGAAQTVTELRQNRFVGISTVPQFQTAGYNGVALFLSCVQVEGSCPRIQRARQNEFVGNDIGILLRGPLPADPAFVAADFGTPGDPGGNVFHCNSTVPRTGRIGHDVEIDMSSASPVALPFAGNIWDEAPPRLTQGARVNGMEIVRSDGVTADTPSSTAVTGVCPPGRVH